MKLVESKRHFTPNIIGMAHCGQIKITVETDQNEIEMFYTIGIVNSSIWMKMGHISKSNTIN